MNKQLRMLRTYTPIPRLIPRLIPTLLILFGLVINLVSFEAQAKTFKIASPSPDGTFWMKQMRAGAAEIKKKTQGRVKFKFYPGGVMGNDDSVMRKIRIHQLHGGTMTNGALGKISLNVKIYGLPFVFSSLEQSDEVRKTTDKLLMQELEENGFVSFGIAKGGFSYMMSKQRIDTLAALKNVKPWVPEDSEVGRAVYEQAGVSPISLPLSDVLIGLQTNLIDTVVISQIGALALQWHTGIKYIVDLPLTYLVASLIVDKKAFYKLKKQDQLVVRDVMSKVYQRIDAQNHIDSIGAREALVNQGIEFVPLSADELKKWYELGEKVRDEMYEKYHFSQAVYKKIHVSEH